MSVEATAIERWNALLRESPLMENVIASLADPDSKPAFVVPGLASMIVLRPLFMTGDRFAALGAAAEVIVNAHRKILEAVLSDDVLKKRHFSGFFEWTEEVLGLDRPGPVDAMCLRLDGSLVDGGPVFIELNADMPGGVSHTDSCAGFLAGLPVMEEFAAGSPARPLLLQEQLLDALLAEWDHRRGVDRPRMGLMVRRDDPVTCSDMENDRRFFASRGCDSILCDPSELDYDGNALFASGKKIDLVYRMVSTAQTLERPDELEALIRAERADAVLLVNSYRSELLGNKTMFALLHDEEFQRILSPEEVAAVRAFIPWTRVMQECFCADPAGKRVDLVRWVHEHRLELVLKPTHDLGGHRVTIGSMSTDSDWERAVADALVDDFVVQKKIPLEKGLYPVAQPGMPFLELYEDLDPLLLRDRFAGCITRLSEDEITNIHRHGAIGALFELL